MGLIAYPNAQTDFTLMRQLALSAILVVQNVWDGRTFNALLAKLGTI